jgi:2-oxoglutarate dehydrogenase E1 component
MSHDLDQFYGPNAGYVLELYERFLQDPTAVDAATRAQFAQLRPALDAALRGEDPPPAAAAPPPATAAALHTAASDTPLDVAHIVGAARLIRYVRELGHLAARLDPLGSEPPGDPGMVPETHSVTEEDLAKLPAAIVRGPLVHESANALEAFAKLRAAYCGAIGYETDQVQFWQERAWIREAAESRRFFYGFVPEHRRDILQRLTEVETFERYLHQTFVGQKRFSIEGCDMLVPMLDSIIRNAAQEGTHEVVIGMAHRGRLNVLAHTLGKPYATILSEFQHSTNADAHHHAGEGQSVAGRGSIGYLGDVKYHLGARWAYKNSEIKEMPITLVPNPSHLEFVNPVVEGRAPR